MRKGVLVPLALGAWLCGPAAASAEPAGAATPAAVEVLAGLQRWLDGTADLAGRFEQSLVSGALGAGVTESGRLVLRRPGRMRWDYERPETKIALVDGRRTRLYVAEDHQLWEGSLDDGGELLPTLLLRQAPLAEWFEASFPPGPEHPATDEDEIVLRLVPRQRQDAFRELRVTLDRPGFELRAAEVLDGAGNRMRYRFQDLRRNRGVPDTAFHFEPPPGTEIVRTEAARSEPSPAAPGG